MGLIARKNPIDLPSALALVLNMMRTGGPGPFSIVWGTAVLVAGTVTVSAQPSIQANSLIFTSYLTSGGATQGVKYKAVPTATGGGFVLTAVDNTGATVATDTSTIMWLAVTPTPHADITCSQSGDNRSLAEATLAVTAANAVDQPTTNALCANLAQVYYAMINDAQGSSGQQSGAHKIIDAVNVSSLALTLPLSSQSDAGLAAGIAFLNALKTNFNAHLAQAGVHYVSDTTNTVATANATDLPSSQTLANALKTAINAHIAIAPLSAGVRVVE